MERITPETLKDYLFKHCLNSEAIRAVQKPQETQFFELPDDTEIETNTRIVDGNYAVSLAKQGDLLAVSSDGRIWTCTKAWFKENFDEVK